MKVKLEKWYLDFTTGEDIGFYYIMVITFGRFKVGFSGINQFNAKQSIQSFRFSRVKLLSLHSLQLSKAELSSNLSSANLQIDHGKTTVKGTWTFLAPPLNRLRKPLHSTPQGWVDWKVWTPKAKVELRFSSGKKTTRMAGTGYIDFVRLTIPFWKMPFQTLYWGRMHSPESWSVFLSLKTSAENIALYYDPQTAVQDASASLKRNELGKAQEMDWTIGSSDNPVNFAGQVTRVLESQQVLSKGRSLRIIPKSIRKKLSSSGRDEKYAMISQFRNQTYHGIMEEVRYHG